MLLSEGQGSALKPACEHWILVRKPIEEKTVAANVLKHGTGGINIDGCRVSLEDSVNLSAQQKNSDSMGYHGASKTDARPKYTNQGRFPANLVLDDQAAEMLDEQSGMTKSMDKPRHNNPSPNIAMSGANLGHVSHGHSDSGGASRFFYVAKASKSDRNAGLEGMPEVQTGSFDGNIDLDNARKIGANPDRPNKPQANHHPTVKNTKLMEYLIKLITPPNGVVLDPFMGSGSTGVAAKDLGYGFIGIEKEPEYFEISNIRLNKKNC